jgi:uncharacterized membrane protein
MVVTQVIIMILIITCTHVGNIREQLREGHDVPKMAAVTQTIIISNMVSIIPSLSALMFPSFSLIYFYLLLLLLFAFYLLTLSCTFSFHLLSYSYLFSSSFTYIYSFTTNFFTYFYSYTFSYFLTYFYSSPFSFSYYTLPFIVSFSSSFPLPSLLLLFEFPLHSSSHQVVASNSP